MKCPNCEKIMEDENVFFLGSEKYNWKVYLSYEGRCHNCNCTWHWEDVYDYIETTIPYQIKERPS